MATLCNICWQDAVWTPGATYLAKMPHDCFVQHLLAKVRSGHFVDLLFGKMPRRYLLRHFLARSRVANLLNFCVVRWLAATLGNICLARCHAAMLCNIFWPTRPLCAGSVWQDAARPLCAIFVRLKRRCVGPACLTSLGTMPRGHLVQLL